MKEYTTTYSLTNGSNPSLVRPLDPAANLQEMQRTEECAELPLRVQFPECGNLHRSKGLSSSTEIVRKRQDTYQVKKRGLGSNIHIWVIKQTTRTCYFRRKGWAVVGIGAYRRVSRMTGSCIS